LTLGRHNAVKLILRAWGKGDDDVVFHTASVAGTHRSVAAAEMIAERLRKKMEWSGVANFDIVVKHPHRQRQAMDPH
jgi:RNase adaptor protein for sRNA GlmZ degradation